MKLIVDSGGTKTTWCCLNQEASAEEVMEKAVTSLGINPVRDSEETVQEAIDKALEILSLDDRFQPTAVTSIYFYGSGCIPPYSTTVKRLLQTVYPNAEVRVESDMLGGALAMCGHHEGIACILGTGSNSCLFDGKRIIQQTPALGFIIGDEGSGTSLGKHLVGDVLKHQLPEPLCQAFLDETGLSQPEIINRVYRQPQPNMFLASLTPFLADHLAEPSIQALVVGEFRSFLVRNIRAYNRPDLPIHFVGGITATFLEELRQAIQMEGMRMGQVLARPITGMIRYHLED